MELDTLRHQTDTLLEKLLSRQSTVKTQLGTLFNGRTDSISMESDVRITTASPVPFGRDVTSGREGKGFGLHSAKIHMHQQPGGAHGCQWANPEREATQSILKRRKVVDDVVEVRSPQKQKQAHQQGPGGRAKLNFDYSDVDDLDMVKKVLRNQLEIDIALAEGDVETHGGVEEVARCRMRRLLDTGNDRQNSTVVRELNARPKSILFDDTASMGRQKFGTSGSHSRLADVTSNRVGEHPLLGYDFIAGLLDNESQLVDRSDAYYDELNEFRRVNKEECIGASELPGVLDLTRPITPEIKDPGHTCIHGYNINERLYAEPLNENEAGRSVCPVCLTARQAPTQEEPAYIRVSIPRSTLQAPYRFKPHRRRSFDDTDNFALSKHCLAGWECSKPAMLPTASTVDLKQATDILNTKLTTTIQDIEAITASYKRIPTALPAPESLLDASRLHRAEVQFNAMSMNYTNPLHSTAY